jgi:hypothetical protein
MHAIPDLSLSPSERFCHPPLAVGVTQAPPNDEANPAIDKHAIAWLLDDELHEARCTTFRLSLQQERSRARGMEPKGRH